MENESAVTATIFDKNYPLLLKHSEAQGFAAEDD
jgi:hypothetical protein